MRTKAPVDLRGGDRLVSNAGALTILYVDKGDALTEGYVTAVLTDATHVRIDTRLMVEVTE